MEQKEDLLVNLTKKYFCQIFCTFLIRIATSYDQSFYNPGRVEKIEDSPNRQSVWSLSRFLECSEKIDLLNALNGGISRKLIDQQDYDEGLVEIIVLYCKTATIAELKQIFEFLCPFLEKKIASQKLVGIITLSQFIASIHNTQEEVTPEIMEQISDWINSLIDIMIANVRDKNEFIRKHALKGLGNVYYILKQSAQQAEIQDKADQQKIQLKQSQQTSIEDQQVHQSDNQNLQENQDKIKQDNLNEDDNQNNEENQQQQKQIKNGFEEETTLIEHVDHFRFEIDFERGNQILQYLFMAMEDYSKMCTREALVSLQKIIGQLDMSIIRPNLFNLIMRLPDSFERDDAIVRMSAFNLFGNVCNMLKRGDNQQKELIESVYFHLLSVLVHTMDDSRAVRQSCVTSLGQIANLFEFEELVHLVAKFQESEIQESGIFDKTENFLIQIVDILWQKHPEKFPNYLNSLCNFCLSPDENIKGAAGLLICICLSKKEQNGINMNLSLIYEKLFSLLEDNSSNVNSKTIKGLVLLSYN